MPRFLGKVFWTTVPITLEVVRTEEGVEEGGGRFREEKDLRLVRGAGGEFGEDLVRGFELVTATERVG